MPCPHFSSESGECLLQEDRDQDDEEPLVAEVIDHDWCVGGEKGYLSCPVYRRFLDEIIPC